MFKFTRMLFIFILMILCTQLYADDTDIKINVIYPKTDQKIALVDSTFIFGNVSKGAELEINGIPIKVYKNGAFLAYLDVTPGEFQFVLNAKKNNITAVETTMVFITKPYKAPGLESLQILKQFMKPSRKIGLLTGDLLEVSFRGTPEKFAYFTLSNDSNIYQMTESPPSLQSYWGKALFGTGDILDSLYYGGVYSGVMSLTNNNLGDNVRIKYYLCDRKLTNLLTLDSSSVRQFADCNCISAVNRNILTVNDPNKIVIGELIDSTQTIRTGPRKGYLSIFQPQGLRFRMTGHYSNYLRAELIDGSDAWMPDSSIKILPVGTLLPSGQVVLIRTESIDGGTIVSFNTGAKLPFRVEEDLANNRIILDVYNCTSNIDWVRYDNSDDLVQSIRWSQPRNDLLRLTIDLNSTIWGYDCFYQGSQLLLKLKAKPSLKWKLRDLRIVIDPGHSPDPGAVGPSGLTEAEANLGIALQLAKILRKKKAKVILTRSDDSPVGIYDRPKIAYKYDADIFISIHNNALPDGVNPFNSNGVSTYFYHPHSQGLAKAIQKRLMKHMDYNDFGTYHANFAVTRPTGYLAVLVECAFMMIPEQEMALRKEYFQKKIAETIVKGITDFVITERKK